MIANTLSTQHVHHGQRISLRVDEFRLGEKPKVSKEIVEHPGSVVILPLTDDGDVVLVRQWRQAAGQVLLEAPSGTREPGEEPMVTAHRELREEAGFSAGTMTSLGGSWVAPGYSTEFTHAYLARNLTHDPLPQDNSEDILISNVPLADVPDLIRNGELQDQMTIAIYYLALHVFSNETILAQPR